MQNPEDYVAWCVTHTDFDICVFGVTKRKLVLTKAQGLVGAHGFTASGWRIHSTITLAPQGKHVSSEAKRALKRRTLGCFPVFYDNDRSLHERVFGQLHMLHMTAEDATRVMSGVRADIRQYAAAKA